MPNQDNKGKKPLDSDANEGEGSRTAARHYDEKATEFARSGKVEPSANEARKAMDSEGEELQRAEDEGKKRIAEEDPEVTLGTSHKKL